MSLPNPFLQQSVLNGPLERDFCQQIHHLALRRAVQGRAFEALPASLPVTELRHQAHWYGSTSLIQSPAAVGEIFQGITLAVYQTIEALYCCRPGRNSRVVWQILQTMAKEAGTAGLTYEAVWAICEYLEAKRATSVAVTCEVSAEPWWLIELRPSVLLQDEGKDRYAPSIVCILEVHPPRVLAFCVVRAGAVQEGAALALYQALVALRAPARDAAAGLRWRLPSQLRSEVALSLQCQQACAALPLAIEEMGNHRCPLPKALQQPWERDLAGRSLTRQQFTVLFDTYLAKCLGTGPLRLQRACDLQFARLKGYSREPTWQFPALQRLLPHRVGYIAADGSIAYDGLHYVDDLLACWSERDVTLVQFPTAEAWAWVYLDDAFLCQVGARELRRRNGTYRPNRAGR